MRSTFIARQAGRVGARWWAAVCLAQLLSGCAVYHSQTLPTQPDWAGQTRALNSDFSKVVLPGPAPASTAGGKAFSGVQLASLAVLNNPDLRALRASKRVTQAQAVVAGMLPPLQASASMDRVDHPGPGVSNGHAYGLSYSSGALLTHKDRKNAEQHHVDQIALALLWQEWQVAQKARLLYSQWQADTEKLTFLQQAYDPHYCSNIKTAANDGDMAPATADAEQADCADSETRIVSIKSDLQSEKAQLYALLGLSPDADLALSRQPFSPSALNHDQALQAVKKIAQQRPDLLALKKGYESQDATLRADILSQVPNITVGLSRSVDTGGVKSTGISLDLPFFTGIKKKIAVDRATRDALRNEYQARIDQADMEARSLIEKRALLFSEFKKMQQRKAGLAALFNKEKQAASQGDIDPVSYFQLRKTLRDVGLNITEVGLNLAKVDISLTTILGMPLHDGKANSVGVGES
ncbi:MAG: TolC family protein [Alcanivorax sp.]|nr:TolC family protein [Alcanivorax sp.]